MTAKLKALPKGLKEESFNSFCDGIPDWEKKSFVNKSKEKCIAYSLKCV